MTASSDQELRLWQIDHEVLGHQLQAEAAGPDGARPARAIGALGTVPRQSTDRAATVRFLPGGHFLACQSLDKTVELFRLVDAKDALRKRRKRAKKRAAAQADGDAEPAEPPTEEALTAADLLVPFHVLRVASAKIRSIDVAAGGPAGTEFSVLTALANNSLEVHTLTTGLRVKKAASSSSSSAAVAAAAPTGPTTAVQHVIEAPGHNSDVRTLALSGDDQLLCTGSSSTRPNAPATRARSLAR